MLTEPANSSIINSLNKYKINDLGPFCVYVDHEKRKRIHPKHVCKLIYSHTFAHKKNIRDIKQIGYSRGRIETNSTLAANSLIIYEKSPLNKLHSYIPSYLTQRQGVNVDINQSDEDILETIRCDVKIIGFRTMVKRIIIDDQI